VAYSFASTNYVQSAGGINSPNSFSMWIRTTQATSNVEILGKHLSAASAGGFGLVMQSTGKLQVYVKTLLAAFTFDALGSISVNDGAWHHVALNIDYTAGGSVKSYVDGVLDISGTNSALSGGSSAVLRLGTSIDTFWTSYVGEIAEFGGWGTTGDSAGHLTADEVAGLAKGFRSYLFNADHLVMYAPLIRELQDVVGDYGALTVSGTSVTPHPRVIG